MKPLFRSMVAHTGCVFVFLATFAWTTSGFAQEDTQAQADAEANVQAQANNPLANMTAFNLQNYYIPSLSELDDQNANNFFLRYAPPLRRQVVDAGLVAVQPCADRPRYDDLGRGRSELQLLLPIRH